MSGVFKQEWQKSVGQKALDKCLEETYSKCAQFIYAVFLQETLD